jgi:hypothetical protein
MYSATAGGTAMGQKGLPHSLTTQIYGGGEPADLSEKLKPEVCPSLVRNIIATCQFSFYYEI